MKNIRLIIPLLSGLFLVACASNLPESDSQTGQKPDKTSQETTQAGEQDADRGFDPCKLNSNLAVCKKQ